MSYATTLSHDHRENKLLISREAIVDIPKPCIRTLEPAHTVLRGGNATVPGGISDSACQLTHASKPWEPRRARPTPVSNSFHQLKDHPKP